MISCGARLAPFDIAELRELTSYDELELDMLGDQRTAMFVIISDTDDTFNFLVAIMYTQLFNLLCDRADTVRDHVLDKKDISLEEQLKEVIPLIQGQIIVREFDELDLNETEDSILADPSVKNFSFAKVGGQVYYRENSRMNRMDLPAVTTERVLGMIELRDITKKLIDSQMEDASEEEIKNLQKELNQTYDTFTAKYGLINSTANRRAFSQDSSYCLLASLEFLDEEGKLKRKADIFHKRTIRKAEPVDRVDTASEALALSLAERAKIDLSFMTELTGKPETEIIEELTGVIFQNPLTEKWETSDEYLSGNVRVKLEVAKQFAENQDRYQVNVQALEKVQPKELEASEIEIRLGATWVDAEYITEFMGELFQTPDYYLGSRIEVKYAPVNGQWNISGKSLDTYGNTRVTATYGTARANAYRLLEDALNLRDTKIYDTIQDADGEATHIKIGEYSDRKTTLLVVMMEQKPETFCFLDALETKCAQSKFQMGDAISFASYRREVDE